MTEGHESSHSPATMMRHVEARAPAAPVPLRAEHFDDVYDAHFSFVWRSARAGGVEEHALDDVTQEIFVAVHKRLGDFEGRSTVRTWLYGIARNVVRAHRRERKKRDATGGPSPTDPDSLHDASEPSPEGHAARAQAGRLVVKLLDSLDDDKREVFVLAELEQLTAQEIADMLQENLNTVYSRLRLAREAFALAAERHRARDAWRTK